MTDENKDNCILSIKGLHCAACVNRVETYLKKNEGVISANVNLATQQAHVEFDNTKAMVEDLKKSIIDAGYEVLGIEDKKKL